MSSGDAHAGKLQIVHVYGLGGETIESVTRERFDDQRLPGVGIDGEGARAVAARTQQLIPWLAISLTSLVLRRGTPCLSSSRTDAFSCRERFLGLPYRLSS